MLRLESFKFQIWIEIKAVCELEWFYINQTTPRLLFLFLELTQQPAHSLFGFPLRTVHLYFLFRQPVFLPVWLTSLCSLGWPAPFQSDFPLVEAQLFASPFPSSLPGPARG
jgi:hypothetical protein